MKIIKIKHLGCWYDCLFDDEDFEKAKNYRWCMNKSPTNFYARSSKNKKNPIKIYAHTLVMGRPPTGLFTDHIDRNGLNNQKSNLRFVTHSENAKNINRKPKGYYWNKKEKKYIVQIREMIGRYRKGSKRPQIIMGRFDSEKDAMECYAQVQ